MIPISQGLLFFIACDGVQDRLPQNMAPWHMEGFKLREFENSTLWHVQEGLSDFPLEQIIKPKKDFAFSLRFIEM